MDRPEKNVVAGMLGTTGLGAARDPCWHLTTGTLCLKTDLRCLPVGLKFWNKENLKTAPWCREHRIIGIQI